MLVATNQTDDRHVGSMTRRSRLASIWWLSFGLMLLALLVPILVVEVPPLLDYPDHLARCFFLAFGPQDPVMRRMFAVRWSVIPNLAMDLILPPLMHVMPPLVAGRLVVALSVLLPATGSVALSRACFRQWSFWQLGVGLVTYNAVFLAGMLNFQLAVGVALWGAACWITLMPRHPVGGALAGAGFGLIAFLFHLFGYLFFTLLIISNEFAAFRQDGPNRYGEWRSISGRGIAIVTALIGPVILYLMSPFGHTSGSVKFHSLPHKLLLLLAPVMGYSLASTITVALALLATLVIWGRQGKLEVAPLAYIALPALFVIYWMLPNRAKGGAWIDLRIPILLGFMLFATVIPRRLAWREARIATVALSALFIGRMAYLTWVWEGSRQDIVDVRQVLTKVAPGRRILVVDGGQLEDRGTTSPPYTFGADRLGNSYRHDGAFALIDRRAFWSDVFAIPGQQPLVPLPPYDLSGDGGILPPRKVGVLADFATVPPTLDPRSFILGWPSKFDYVLVLGANNVSDIDGLLPRYLTLLDDRGIAALFAIKHEGADP